MSTESLYDWWKKEVRKADLMARFEAWTVAQREAFRQRIELDMADEADWFARTVDEMEERETEQDRSEDVEP